MSKRFEMSYTSGSTGYGWHIETDSIKEVYQSAQHFKHERTAFFSVWDNERSECIFHKDVLTFNVDTDLLDQYVSRYQKYYWRKQSELRESAIEWQYKTFSWDDGEEDTDYLSLYEWAEHFRKYGKRFGLLEEFKENAII